MVKWKEGTTQDNFNPGNPGPEWNQLPGAELPDQKNCKNYEKKMSI